MPSVIERRIVADQPDLCTVVVIYDDGMRRVRALRACDYLLRQEWENVELDFHWWRSDFLRDLHMGAAAARHAIASDILIVCSRVGDEISPTLEAWFETWIGLRKNHEGALIDLDATQPVTRPSVLHRIAERGGFDYLTAVPEQTETGSLEPAQNPSAPARMNDRLAQSHPPSHFGLNE